MLLPIIITILVAQFLIDTWLDYLNAKRFKDPIPEVLGDVYDQEAYLKSQDYKMVSYRFGLISSSFSLVTTLLFLLLGGFTWADELARSFTSHPTVIALLFFAIVMGASSLLQLPFDYYRTFTIESQFGFNKSSRALFFMDKVKGLLIGGLLAGVLLTIIMAFYQWAGTHFWLYAWAIMALFTLLLNTFYSQWIVPLFNKQTPLEEGELKSAITQYARTIGFELENIYVIDGSKRSTKANAYFSGIGNTKRITLFDTLIKDLTTDEIVAVLAHEVGHYKHRHIIYNLLSSLLITGVTLWLLSLCISIPAFSQAIGVAIPSFHAGLITFGIMYSPISELTGLLMNGLSRTFEYQADAYAKKTFSETPLITALKKLSKNHLSNLTPHPFYVWVNYSHPTLLQRVNNLHKW